MTVKHCVNCGEEVSTARYALGFKTCLCCGEELAKSKRHTIVPMAKSNYIPVSDPRMLKQLNKYSNA